MKYLLSFRERASGSFQDYEAAQERALGLLQAFAMPKTLKIIQFLSRLGEFGGYIVVETDAPGDLHELTTVFALFECKVEPVLDIGEAIEAETKAITFRKAHDAAAGSKPRP